MSLKSQARVCAGHDAARWPCSAARGSTAPHPAGQRAGCAGQAAACAAPRRADTAAPQCAQATRRNSHDAACCVSSCLRHTNGHRSATSTVAPDVPMPRTSGMAHCTMACAHSCAAWCGSDASATCAPQPCGHARTPHSASCATSRRAFTRSPHRGQRVWCPKRPSQISKQNTCSQIRTILKGHVRRCASAAEERTTAGQAEGAAASVSSLRPQRTLASEHPGKG